MFRQSIILFLSVWNFSCAAILANQHVSVRLRGEEGMTLHDGGVYIGAPGQVVALSTRRDHYLELKDAAKALISSCTIPRAMRSGYVVVDSLLLLLYLVPGIVALAVDGGTDSWYGLTTEFCPLVERLP